MHAAIKGPSPVGHLKAEGHLGGRHLKRRTGGAANSMLSAAGCSFRRILS
jgi:hypothetical protein